MVGVNGPMSDQLELLRTICTPDLVAAATGVWERANARNRATGYGAVEAVVLFCFVRRQAPRRIVQIGAGTSTSVILDAAAGRPLSLMCVDPWPTVFLRDRSRTGDIELVTARAQDLPLDRLCDLEHGDLLFIDSTHTVKPGSEVNWLVFEVLPRLKPGVWVHFHDIFWPYDYQHDLLDDALFFWLESVLLHAFMTGNIRFRTELCLSMIHHQHSDALRAVIPSYAPLPMRDGLRASRRGDFPSATYIRAHS